MTSSRNAQNDESSAGEENIVAGAVALAEHARWILEAHNARADGIQQRAMGFLSVVGVMLGLVLTSLNIVNAPHLALVRVFTVLTLFALIAASGQFVRCLRVGTVTLPSVETARKTWNELREGSIDNERIQMLITNDFLGGPDSQEDPLSTAENHANLRARRLKYGVVCLLVAFALLAALILTFVLKTGRG